MPLGAPGQRTRDSVASVVAFQPNHAVPGELVAMDNVSDDCIKIARVTSAPHFNALSGAHRGKISVNMSWCWSHAQTPSSTIETVPLPAAYDGHELADRTTIAALSSARGGKGKYRRRASHHSSARRRDAPWLGPE